MAKNKNTDGKKVDTVSIDGNVNITIKSGKRIISRKTIHNEGTVNLFYGLIRAMGGDVSNNYLPKYLDVGYGERAESSVNTNTLENPFGIERSLLSANVGGIARNENNAQTTYQGLIPYSNILGNSSTPIRELGIFGTKNTNTLLARIQLTEEDSFVLNPGQSIIVQWTFSIQNVLTDDTTAAPSSSESHI